MANELTDRAFWQKYWESKKGLIVEIPRKYVFHDIFNEIFSSQKVNSAIELGGFPGYYAVFLSKFYQSETTLLDYFVYPSITKELVQKNGLSKDAIEIIEADLFNYQPQKQYNLVLSCGLIEHFEDTKSIIKTHIQFLAKDGKLLITLPNFTGVNGWVQKTFDFANYEKHNIKSMNPQLLKNIAEELGLKDVRAYYYGGFSTWLENKEEKSFATKLFVKTIWYAGKLITKAFNFESKFFSPYIILEAKKTV
ncbi:MAG: methyltransferase domain-containing protein [Sphingobacteriales bacterium]|nr:methyltransferase domain-containing protein [Sphingobacteriales bacterium]